MNKKVIYSFITILVLFNVLIISKNQTLRKNFAKYTHQVNRAKIFKGIQLESLLRFDNTQVEIDEIKELELCYIVSKLHCNQCVDSILSVIQDFDKGNPSFHFRILAKYNSRQDLLIFKRLHGIDFPIIPVSELGFPIVETEVPLLFIYDPDNKKATHVFAPDPDDAGLTQNYLSLINQKMFTNIITNNMVETRGLASLRMFFPNLPIYQSTSSPATPNPQ